MRYITKEYIKHLSKMHEYIDFNKNASLKVKGIAILLMIAHHLFSQNTFAQISSVPLPQLYQQIGQMGKICVSIYMFIGGYAFLLSKEKSLLKRLWHIYKKFLTTFLIITIILLFTNKLYVTPMQYIQNALCISWEINGSWWFISTYILYIICFSFIIPLLLNTKWHLQFVILLFFLFILPLFAEYIRCVQGFNITLRSQLHYFFYYIGFFYLGIIFYHFNLFHFVKKSPKSIILLILGLLSFLYIRIISNINWTNYILIIILISLVNYIPTKEKILQVLGKYSMSMWLIHMFFIEKRYFIFQFEGQYSPLHLYCIIVILSLCYAIFESYLISYTKNLTKHITIK